MPAVANFTTIIRLPEGYRPNSQIIENYPAQDGTTMGISINLDGTIALFNNNKAIDKGFFCRKSFYYPERQS